MTPDHANGIPASKDANAVEASSPGVTGPEICARCRKPLTKRGADGECLRCLVGFALTPEDTDGDVARASSPERLGQQNVIYGHFELAAAADGTLLELGHGAMGTTYRARDTILRTAVALKVIEQSMAQHPAARARFLREARAAARLHHPNVASVSHYGEQDGECYYVMELVEGETLDARVRSAGPLPPALAVEIGVQVARALAAAEACGVVHRDLKPSNIMLTTPQGEKTDGNATTVVKVIDWGLAKAVSAESALGIDQTHGGFCRHTGIRQPGAVFPVGRSASRSSLGHLFARRDPLVHALRTDAFHGDHPGRNSFSPD